MTTLTASRFSETEDPADWPCTSDERRDIAKLDAAERRWREYLAAHPDVNTPEFFTRRVALN